MLCNIKYISLIPSSYFTIFWFSPYTIYFINNGVELLFFRYLKLSGCSCRDRAIVSRSGKLQFSETENICGNLSTSGGIICCILETPWTCSFINSSLIASRGLYSVQCTVLIMYSSYCTYLWNTQHSKYVHCTLYNYERTKMYYNLPQYTPLWCYRSKPILVLTT